MKYNNTLKELVFYYTVSLNSKSLKCSALKFIRLKNNFYIVKERLVQRPENSAF